MEAIATAVMLYISDVGILSFARTYPTFEACSEALLTESRDAACVGTDEPVSRPPAKPERTQ